MEIDCEPENILSFEVNARIDIARIRQQSPHILSQVAPSLPYTCISVARRAAMPVPE